MQSITTVVIQMAWQPGEDASARRERLRKKVHEAVEGGAHLVVLPPWSGLMALDLGAPLEPGASRETSPDGERSLAEILRQAEESAGQSWQAAYDAYGGEFASEAGCYLLPGSVPVPVPGGFHHLATLFSPEGEPRLTQYQTHALPPEREAGLLPGDRVEVAEIEGWRIAITLGTDCRYPEVGRIQMLEGADLVLMLSTLEAPFNPWRQVAGPWQVVQQCQFFAAEAPLTGHLFGRDWAGRATLHAPVEITPGDTGVLDQAEDPLGEEAVQGRSTLEELRGIRERYPLRDYLNPSLYEAHMPRIYRNWPGGEPDA